MNEIKWRSIHEEVYFRNNEGEFEGRWGEEVPLSHSVHVTSPAGSGVREWKIRFGIYGHLWMCGNVLWWKAGKREGIK